MSAAIDWTLYAQLNDEYVRNPPPKASADRIAKVRQHLGLIDPARIAHPNPIAQVAAG